MAPKLFGAGKGNGGEDADRSTLWTTPWAWRDEDGGYYGYNGQVWLYRSFPLSPIAPEWEDVTPRLRLGQRLEQILVELGETSRESPMGFRSMNDNREIHVVSVTWEQVARPPAGTPEGLTPYQEETLGFTVPAKALLIGVRLRSASAPTPGKKKGGLIDQLKDQFTNVLGEGVPDPARYETDRTAVNAIFERAGCKVPSRDEMRQLESWYNLGRGTDALLVEERDHVVVDGVDRIELAAVLDFHRTVRHAPHFQWIADAEAHNEPCRLVSVRAELEPASVARKRARSTQRRIKAQIDEEMESGDIDRPEYSDTYQLAQSIEEHFINANEPLMANVSMIMARRATEANETYIDHLRNSYEIEVRPLDMRQMPALDETLPCSSKRVNPFVQDLSVAMVAYAGLHGFSDVGDRKGAYLGLTHPNLTPAYLDFLGAPAANKPPITAIFGDPGSGKAQPLDAKILTPSGWKRMGDIAVGDDVVGSDGKAHQVTGVFPQGEKDIYRVTFNDGATVECCDEHLWAVATSGRLAKGLGWQVRPLSELRQAVLDGQGKRQWRIPMVAAVEHPAQDLPVDPYLLGVLLGGGGLTARVAVSSADEEIITSVRELVPAGVKVVHRSRYDYDLCGPGRGKPNPLRDAIRDLGLFGKRSHEKFIPQRYLVGSVEQRLALLQGLMDTDGYLTEPRTGSELTSTSESLIEGVAELARSLGGTATVTAKSSFFTRDGERVDGRPAWRVRVNLPAQFNPFRLSRKASQLLPRTTHRPSRSIASIDFVGVKEAQCIRVNAPDHLYVTDDHVLTHNTFLSQMIALQANLAGLPVTFINPKGGDTLSPLAEVSGGQVVSMSKVSESGGAFDPFRFVDDPVVAAEVLSTHILSVLTGFTEAQELALTAGLVRGGEAGARCALDALRHVQDREVIERVAQQVKSSSMFALGFGTKPQPPLTNTKSLTLIEFDRNLDLPDPSSSARDYTRADRITLAAMGLVTRASMEILSRAGGGVLIVDEAWAFLAHPAGKAALQRMGRLGRSLNVLPIFATQRVADLVGSDMEGFLSRVFVMALHDPREASAALKLCGVEATEARLQWLAQAGPDRETGRWAMALHRDLRDRHSAVLVGPVPPWAYRAFTTNPAERARIKAMLEAQAATGGGPIDSL